MTPTAPVVPTSLHPAGSRRHGVADWLVLSAIVVVVAVAVAMLAASFWRGPRLSLLLYHALVIDRFVQRLVSVILLFVAWNLVLRKRAAWLTTVLLLSGSLLWFVALHHQIFRLVIVGCQLYALVVLLAFQNRFRRPTQPLSARRAGIIAAGGLLVVFLDAVAGRAALAERVGAPMSLGDSLVATLRLLIGEDTGFPRYQWFVFGVVWACVATCAVLLLHSTIVTDRTTRAAHARARDLVLRYGTNPLSYLALERDKTLFFGRDVEGVLAYGLVGGVVVVNGDPVCAPGDVVAFLAEFKGFCRAHSLQAVFLSATDAFLDAYALLGYHRIKCGEEPRFDLAGFGLAGAPRAKVRNHANHARGAGLTTHEYRPLDARDPAVERGIQAVSAAWLARKRSGELGFIVGGGNLDDPLDRRYFYAAGSDGTVVAFSVFLPFVAPGGRGYLVDVTRRLPGVSGATELIAADAFAALRDEGAAEVSLGVAPLAGLTPGEDDVVRSLAFAYKRLNSFYGFKALRIAKAKYGPDRWEPAYFLTSTRGLTPELLYAIVTIQNPGGLLDFVRSFVRDRWPWGRRNRPGSTLGPPELPSTESV